MLASTVNYLAVVVATLASMVLGMIWYAPFVFGKQWMRLVELTGKDTKDNRGASMVLMLLGALVASYTMANFIGFVHAQTISDGIRLGVWVGIGFVFTAAMGETIFSQRSPKLLAITAGYQIVNLMMIGAILAAWQ